jgi:nucleoside-diphosphate-sugar epimerase
LNSPILVTGNKGKIGRVVEPALRAHGHDVAGFDLLDGKDIRDIDALRAEMSGCGAVVHLAALKLNHSPKDVFEVNVLGTWNVLAAGEAARVRRIVYFSSVNALGVFLGMRAPDYLPIDDDHPCYPSNAYGVSKRMAEEMCRCFTARTNIPTICLRPPGVWTDENMRQMASKPVDDPDYERTPFWEYGCFIHASDLADATAAALICPDVSHEVLLVNAPDIWSGSKTSRELPKKRYPEVTWRGGGEYEKEPFRPLMVTTRAQKILDWSPRIGWRSGSTPKGDQA